MARKSFVDSREYPYHVTCRANNREAFPGELSYVWKIVTGELYLQSTLCAIRIHAFVLMPNHFHLLITTPQAPLYQVMKEVIGSTTRTINVKLHRSGRIFGGPYHWSLIQEPTYYAHALKYVYRNPVKAGLCERPGEYEFSSLHGLLGKGNLPLRVLPPLLNLDCFVPGGHKSVFEFETWLNQPHRAEENEAIRKGLRKRVFSLDANRNNRKRIHLGNLIDAVPSPEST